MELLGILLFMLIIGFFINYWLENHEIRWYMFLIIAGIYNLIVLGVSLKPIKTVAKGLTMD